MRPTHAAVSIVALAVLLVCPDGRADTLHDPTRPATLPTAALVPKGDAAVHLEAILGTDKSRLAIINGKVVHVGERVADALITEIGPQTIRYVRNGQIGTLKLPDPRIPVRTAASPSQGAQ
jgi:hypothetical protein